MWASVGESQQKRTLHATTSVAMLTVRLSGEAGLDWRVSELSPRP